MNLRYFVGCAGWLSLLLLCCGCQMMKSQTTAWNASRFNPGNWMSSSLRSQSPDDEDEDAKEDEFETVVRTPMIGEYTTVTGLNMITLQGVGLVTGLDGTGGDPPPSSFRTALLDEMRRRGVRNPNEILRSPTTALVVVRAYLPPMCKKGDKFDIEVRVPDESGVTSLNGGWLMETFLSESALIPGQGVMKGHLYAKAEGPVLVSTGEGDAETSAGLMRRGRVLGGARSLTDRNLALYLRNDFRSVRNSKRIADKIGLRFYDYNASGLRESLAEAKTDQKIELIVLPRYRDNFPRYLQVIRAIAFREDDVARRVRMERLQTKLLDPATAERAAIELEAIGTEAVPILRRGLESQWLEVRFHSSVAITYLGESYGLKGLAEAARKEPAFRVFALAAMSATEDAEASLLLRELMDETSPETRYGAFRALTTLDKNDPFVRDEGISEEFQFHVLNTSGPPLIHLNNRKRAEVVIFGQNLEFRTPLALRAGSHILVTAPAGGSEVTVGRYRAGSGELRKVVSRRVEDVIRAAVELGATYPDVSQMISQAEKQQVIAGNIAVDALPQAGRIYYRPGANPDVDRPTKTRVGRTGLVPNLYSTDKMDLNNGVTPSNAVEEDEGEDVEDAIHEDGSASLADVSPEDTKSKASRSSSANVPFKESKWYDVRRFFQDKQQDLFVEPDERLR